jgi:glycosidase
MQWDASRHAGFSTGADTWLPLAPDCESVNVARQRGDPASLLSFYRRVIWYRKASPALLDGTYRPVDSPRDTFVYLREHGSQRLLVALNFGREARTVALPEGQRGSLVLSTLPDRVAPAGGEFALAADEGIVVQIA